ncbi:insulin-induced protein-domain-containing protein [Chaetomium tenue]|uniref:Insulin-induced protein-domain-containing protein n=1 Tax=Chaetomium tenue TaxID=1854479 RepID=A0ACB7P1I3_9PEZI|nr:insulin-induced protein-domain-containing protein [Chaetomium globosum]
MGDTSGEGVPNTSGPKIIRPIPRRPFKPGFLSPTPPEEDDDRYSSSRPQISASDLRFLAPHQHAAATPSSGSRDGSTPISHNASYLNLTSPTLFGIYSPSTLDSSTKDEDDQDEDHYFRDSDRSPGFDTPGINTSGINTPGGAPIPRPGLDDKTYALMRRRSSLHKPRQSSRLNPAASTPSASAEPPRPARKREVALQLALRAILLFVLGMGYGVLVTRLPQNSHNQHHPTHRLAAAYESHYEWRYLVFWGAVGVALGSLLPWFDRFWEETAARSSRNNNTNNNNTNHPPEKPAPAPTSDETDPNPDTTTTDTNTPPPADWALVVRGIGAFVGIVFAIRKLPWASTMQVSLTLALANPFLWYLIDRSKPGFLLSAAVGLAGSAVLMRLGGPGVMPAPASGSGSGSVELLRGLGAVLGGNGSVAAGGLGAAAAGEAGGQGQVGYAAAAAAAAGALGGLASQETIETSLWMLSVLFCSCVCFGNIGRRLALNSSAAGRGRWGGVR